MAEENSRISRQERLLYGRHAALVRSLGGVAAEAEKVRTVIEEALESSREADSITSQAVNAKGYDETGRSEHTVWLDEIYAEIYEFSASANNLFRETAWRAAEKEIDSRKSIDSLPSPA